MKLEEKQRLLTTLLEDLKAKYDVREMKDDDGTLSGIELFYCPKEDRPTRLPLRIRVTGVRAGCFVCNSCGWGSPETFTASDGKVLKREPGIEQLVRGFVEHDFSWHSNDELNVATPEDGEEATYQMATTEQVTEKFSESEALMKLARNCRTHEQRAKYWSDRAMDMKLTARQRDFCLREAA